MLRGRFLHYFVFAVFLLTRVNSQWVHSWNYPWSDDVWEVNFSPDGKYVVVASNDGKHGIITV